MRAAPARLLGHAVQLQPASGTTAITRRILRRDAVCFPAAIAAGPEGELAAHTAVCPNCRSSLARSPRARGAFAPYANCGPYLARRIFGNDSAREENHSHPHSSRIFLR